MDALAAYAARFRAELLAAGWHISDDDGFAIAGRFKSGKPKKTPSVWIRHFDRSTESVINAEGELVTVPRELTGTARPWRVDSWRFKEGKTLARLADAFDVFIEEARASDPATAKGVWAGH